jgi:predicted O-methyltransferase YrrM
VTNVLHDTRVFYPYEGIESVRRQLLKDKTLIEIEDFGAGSVDNGKKRRTIGSIARHAAKGKKLSQLLFRIVHYYQPKTILELGTSLGISSAYMASANPAARIVSIEGASSVAELAKHHHKFLHVSNVEVRTGEFNDILPDALQQLRKVDLVFIDGNHRREPTIQYFRQLLPHTNAQSMLIFDDIHWSEEMEEAWETIKKHPAVTASIDLFFIGIILFRPEFKSKQHFTIRF